MNRVIFRADVPSHAIDLGRPEFERWADVIAAERDAAGRLVRAAAVELERIPEVARCAFATLYRLFGGLYWGEIRSWARALGESVGTVTLLNCAYELSHVSVPRWLGCTAGVRWIEGLGMAHVRTLDWPLPGMSEATRVFRFRQDGREFVAVGVPGQVGVLSGMRPGAYSVTINWAPPTSFPTFHYGPTFLLRETLESCDTYAAAVERLRYTRLSTSVFFTVCGSERDQACVIERTPREAVVRTMGGAPLVQANHHVATAFADNNEAIRDVPPGEEVFSLDGSSRRADLMYSVLDQLSAPYTLESVANALDVETVLNSQTCQKMVFCPRTGELGVWRRAAAAAAESRA